LTGGAAVAGAGAVLYWILNAADGAAGRAAARERRRRMTDGP
jgi:hypothetical protein